MIANITKGNFLKPLIEYNEKKINKKEAKLLSVENTLTNSKGQFGYENALQRISELGYNSKRKDKFFHVSINFPETDKKKINDFILKNIAVDYMNKSGFIDMPYVIYKHDDTNHPHIHIIASNINEQKKAITTSNDRINSQKITRELEIKYDLTIVSSQKKESQSAAVPGQKFNSLKEELNFHVKNAIQKYRVQNFAEMQLYLNDKNLDAQILKGVKEVDGKKIDYDGLVFNKFDTNFKQSQKGIKASSLYFKPTLKNLEKAFKRNTAFHKSNRKSIKNQLDFTLGSYEKITVDDLKAKLLLKDIELNTKYDSKYNLVGTSFTDMKSGYKYTGEQIGKNYTAKNLADHIGIKTEIKASIITNIIYKKYAEKIENLDINQKIQTLITLGFKVQFENNALFISDYKNKPGEGYIKLIDTINFNPTIIDLFKNSKSIKFNNLTDINKLHFEYNRSKFDKNSERSNFILDRINLLENPKSDAENIGERKHMIKSNLDNLYNDIYDYQTDNKDESNAIADIDKNSKKKPRRRR